MEDIDQSTVAEALREILTEHGLDCVMQGEWVLPNGRLPAIRAHWESQGNSGLLDVQVLLDQERFIEECFAGIGEGRSAISDGLKNFMVNSLHVLLSSLWGISDDDHVLRETWNIGGRQFNAYVGNIGVRTMDGLQVSPPEGLFETIQHRLGKEDLRRDIHWFRIFFGSLAKEHSYEALRDNEPWESGIAGLKELAWPETDSYYSFRIFMVLRSV
jgi:hypothetical protein